jgi:tetratricopeptide (TPR) repeat protein
MFLLGTIPLLQAQQCGADSAPWGSMRKGNSSGQSSRAVFLTALMVFCSWEAAATSSTEVIQQIQDLIQQGDLITAASELKRAVQQFPNEPGLYNLMGVVEAQQGNYPKAESHFKKAVEKAPQFTGAYLNLGRLYQEHQVKDAGALKKGLEIYQKILNYQPNHVEANYQTAQLLQREGSYKTSLNHLSRLPVPEQERAQALSVRCADHVGLRDESEAGRVAERLLKSSDLAEADVLSIWPVFGAHPQETLEERLLTGLVERQLASTGTLHQLALLYERQGKLQPAREMLENVAQKANVSAGLLSELARVAYKQGDFQGTLGYLAHARDLEPQNAGIHFFFGMVCVTLDLAQDAYDSLKKAVSLDSGNAYYNYALGAVTVQRKDPSEAIPYFQKYLQLKPQDPRGRFALGVAYFHSGDAASTRRELQAVAQSSETAAGAHFFLGRLAKQEDKLDEAVTEVREAVKINPQYSEAYAELGLLYMRQKEYEQSEKSLMHALEIDPDSYPANMNLLNLFQRTKDQRAQAQAQRFEEIKKKRSEKEQALLRTLDIRPY